MERGVAGSWRTFEGGSCGSTGLCGASTLGCCAEQLKAKSRMATESKVKEKVRDSFFKGHLLTFCGKKSCYLAVGVNSKNSGCLFLLPCSYRVKRNSCNKIAVPIVGMRAALSPPLFTAFLKQLVHSLDSKPLAQAQVVSQSLPVDPCRRAHKVEASSLSTKNHIAPLNLVADSGSSHTVLWTRSRMKSAHIPSGNERECATTLNPLGSRLSDSVCWIEGREPTFDDGKGKAHSERTFRRA